MFPSASQLLGTAAAAYGVLAALAVLLQARQMLARRTSCDVSGRFFACYAGGYALWLAYGLSSGNVQLIVVDAAGLLCGGLTLAVALSLRGSLAHPASWTSCTAIPATGEGPTSLHPARRAQERNLT
jgi:MtN3 and saliva related transmembrane protein